MKSQKSYEVESLGKLYLVATPIGNLEDMTFRCVRLLKEADWIAAEDTRNTKKLCNYFDITTPIVSYHDHNKRVSGGHLIEKLQSGQTVALVSDAGMPCISDPGYELVQEAIEAGISVIPLPGANAALTALIASGLVPQPFYFYGFLSRDKKQRKRELEELTKQTSTFILYESPHRLKDTLHTILDILGERPIVLCRELTKKFEEFLRGTTAEAVKWAEDHEIRGEFCMIIEGSEKVEEPNWWETLGLREHVLYYIDEKGLSSKDAIKKVAVERTIQKREVYQAYHEIE
ncbi:16S rRNA methyltransferase [Bacillus coahuilensis m2-6]|uniref:16S rRNA (cytidine(1402)-2'-O)-methyltransferase n=1 Tax=Bacillus coahuilensis TaxID=408580 RepID=UPI0001850808|nr:16S rRNA (cytidine(1402)-2'-O)-methyltransferase [Bacillus coahuilensis]KUP04233.1 16S rRNA methyltransferase [Bacillus coahuilensis m2-6]